MNLILKKDKCNFPLYNLAKDTPILVDNKPIGFIASIMEEEIHIHIFDDCILSYFNQNYKLSSLELKCIGDKYFKWWED